MGKVRCKNAARNRRSDENSELRQLSEMLPLNAGKNSMDKATVVRLTNAYFRLKEISEGFEGESSSDEHKESCSLKELSSHLLECLNGFLLIVGLDGKIIYVSETVTSHLGLSQIEMTGDLVYGYIHPDDKSELESLLVSFADLPTQAFSDAKIPVTFPIRMKCSLSRRHSAFVADGHKIIHCSGYLKFGTNISSQYGSDPIVPSQNRTRRHPGSGLILTCHSFPSSIETVIRLFPHMFMFRLGLDFMISYADGEVLSLTGYEPSHLHGKQLYNFLHPQHMFQIQTQHTILLEKGQAITPYYAFLTNGGGWIWMQSYFVLMKYGKPPRDSIVACNYVISERQHVNLVIDEEQNCMLNSCCKVSKYNKRTTSSINNSVSKRSNDVFKCCFSSESNSQEDNTFTTRKMKTSKKTDFKNKSKQIQSSVSTNVPNMNYQDSEQLKHLGMPLSSRGTGDKLCTGNFMIEKLREQTICDPESKWISDQSSLSLPNFQKNSQISIPCESLKNFQQLQDNKAFSINPHFCTNLSDQKQISSFDFQKNYVKPTSFDSSMNNDGSKLVVPKLDDGNVLNPVLDEIYTFPKKFEETAAAPLVPKTGVDDSFSVKSESILKTLLTKSPDIRHPSSDKRPHLRFDNINTFSYHKGQLMQPTCSKLILETKFNSSADSESINLRQPTLLSPVSETAMDFNCLQIRPTIHLENESSKEGASIYSKEFPSARKYILSNIRETPHDFPSANAKRIKSNYNCLENNNSIIDSVVPLQTPQMEINNNQLPSPETQTYNCLLDNTIVGSNTKFFFGDGQLRQKFQISDLLEKENLTFDNLCPPTLKANKFQRFENNSLFHSLTPPWSNNRNSQHQYSERKVLSLKQELELFDFNKNGQYQHTVTKALSSSVTSDRLDINTYFTDQSFETKILSSSMELDRSDIINKEFQMQTLETKILSSSVESDRSDINTYFKGQSLETKFLSSSLESDRTEIEENFQSLEGTNMFSSFKSHCNNHSRRSSYSNDFNEDDFPEITIVDVDSDPESLFSSVTFETFN